LVIKFRNIYIYRKSDRTLEIVGWRETKIKRVQIPILVTLLVLMISLTLPATYSLQSSINPTVITEEEYYWFDIPKYDWEPMPRQSWLWYWLGKPRPPWKTYNVPYAIYVWVDDIIPSGKAVLVKIYIDDPDEPVAWDILEEGEFLSYVCNYQGEKLWIEFHNEYGYEITIEGRIVFYYN